MYDNKIIIIMNSNFKVYQLPNQSAGLYVNVNNMIIFLNFKNGLVKIKIIVKIHVLLFLEHAMVYY